MAQLSHQRASVGGRYVGQTADDRALQRLTGKEHTLYRPVVSLFTNQGGRLYQTIDGRRFVCEGEGPATVCRWV